MMCRIVHILFFSLAIVTGAQAAGRGVRLVSSDEAGVLLEVDGVGYSMRSVLVDGQRFDQIDLPGGMWLPEPGRPAVPVRSALVGIPYGARVSVTVVEAEYEEVAEVELMPVPGAVGEEQVAGESVQMRTVPSPEFYAQDRFFPTDQAVVSRVGILRDQQVATVSLRPVQYNPVRKLLRVARRLRVRVQFVRSFEQQMVQSVRPNESDAFESLYQNGLLNAQQASVWRGRVLDGKEKALRKQAADWYDPAAVYYKVHIREDGLYRLDAKWFEDSGILLQPGGLDRLKMFLNGEETLLHVQDGGDGRLDEGEGVYFYGSFRRAPDRDFENELGREQVYWLTLDGGAGRRFVVGNAAPISGFPDAVRFQDRVHVEVDSLFDPLSAAPDANRDHWFWLRTGSPGKPGSVYENVGEFPVTVGVSLPGLDPGASVPARVRVGMHGLTFRTQFSPDHHTVVRLGDGTVVADDRWDGVVAFVANGEVPASVLTSTTAVTLATPGAPDFPDTYIENVLLNWVEITYSRRYEAVGGRLKFEPNVTEGRTFSVGGFGTPQVQVYDLEGGQVFTGVVVSPQGTGYRARFELANPAGQFLAVETATAQRPALAQLDVASRLSRDGAGAEYVIVTGPTFRAAAEQLADHRRAGGLRTMVVDVDDIYDEFSFGQFEPEAIRRFVQYAFETWDVRPTYLLLFGRASFDYRDFFDQVRFGRKNHVPALPFQGYSLPAFTTRGLSFTDHQYGMVAGDDPFLDVFVGRLSVNNVREAETVVRKVTGYDLAPPAPWHDRVLYMANYEEPAVYADASDAVAALTTEPLGLETFRVYNKKDTPPEPNEDTREVIRQINEGRLVVNYSGHGSVSSMQNFLRGTYQQQDYSYMSQIRNEDRLPMVVALSCLNGQYADPRFACLAEEMTVKSDGGAIAYVSASELALSYVNTFLNRVMFQALFTDGIRRPSVSLALAKIGVYEDSEVFLPSLYAMNLIGDPAQELRVPPGPDFVLPADGLRLEKSGVLTVADSTRVRIRLVNRGIVSGADVDVLLLDRNLDRGEVDPLFSGRVPSFGQEDSITVYWRLAGRAGRHLLEAVVDPDDRIAELDERNNEVELEAEVFGALQAVVTMPRQSQVVSAAAAHLVVRVEDGVEGEVLGEFEVSRSSEFGDAVRSGVLGGEEGLVHWQPAGLSEGTYFWRARLTDGKETGAWTPVQMFGVSSSVPDGELIWRQRGTEARQLGGGIDVALDGNGHVARVQEPPPMRFTEETREASFPAEGVAGTAVLCADGTYVYVTRFYSPSANYPGKDVFGRIGTGFGGASEGKNFGVASETPVQGISATYHSDGFIYAGDGRWESLVRISPVTGVADRVNVPAGLLELRNGLASEGHSLITSDGTHIYNVSAGVAGVRRAGWLVRVFNPDEDWRLVREFNVEPTSTGFTFLHTDGIIADGRYLYLVEFGTGLTHRVRVVDAQDGHFIEEFESDQAQTDLLNGQYDWVNNKVWFGQLNGPMIHRYAGIRLPESGSLTSGPIGPAGGWSQLQIALQSSGTGRAEVDILGEDVLGTFRPLEGWTGLSPAGGIDLSPLGADVRRLRVRVRLFGEALRPSPGMSEWSVRYQPVSDLALSGLTAEPTAVQELEMVRLGVVVLNRGPLDGVRGASVAFYSGQPEQGRLIGRTAVPQQTPLGKKAQVTLVWNTARFPGSNLVTARIEDASGRPGLNARTIVLEESVEVAPSGDADAPTVELTALDAAGEVRPDDYLPSEPRFLIVLRDSSGINASSVRIRLTSSAGEVPVDLTSPEVTSREGDETSLRFEYGPTLEDDRYELTVSGEDQIGNGPAQKTLVFQVSSDLRIEKVLNVPNPMSDETEFTYILSHPASVVVRVYTVAGRLVRVLDGLPGRAGFNQVRWDGRDAGGHMLANGVYLYTVTADDGQEKARVKERLIVYR